MAKIFITFFLITLLFPASVHAQVVVNEISTSSSPDWIELYAYEDVDISGWVLDDFGTATSLKEFSQETLIGSSYSSMFLVVEVGDRLNNSGDVISLYDDEGNLIDEINYGNKGGVCIPGTTESIGRYPEDAVDTIERFYTPSKGTSNVNSTLNPCPSPTPFPSNTPTPTPEPTYTSTPVPTNTPVPTQTPTITPTKTTTPTEEIEDAEKENSHILGVEESEERNDEEESLESEEIERGKFPLASGAFIISGLGLISFPVISYIRSKKGYNHKDG